MVNRIIYDPSHRRDTPIINEYAIQLFDQADYMGLDVQAVRQSVGL